MATSKKDWASQNMIRCSLAIKDIMELIPNQQYDYLFDKFNILLAMLHTALQWNLDSESDELRQESIRCARRIDRSAESQGLISNIEQEWTEWFDILYSSTEPM